MTLSSDHIISSSTFTFKTDALYFFIPSFTVINALLIMSCLEMRFWSHIVAWAVHMCFVVRREANRQQFGYWYIFFGEAKIIFLLETICGKTRLVSSRKNLCFWFFFNMEQKYRTDWYAVLEAKNIHVLWRSNVPISFSVAATYWSHSTLSMAAPCEPCLSVITSWGTNILATLSSTTSVETSSYIPQRYDFRVGTDFLELSFFSTVWLLCSTSIEHVFLLFFSHLGVANTSIWS